MNLPSPYNRKKTKRETMSSPAGSMSVKGGNCKTESEIFCGKGLFY